MVRKKKRADLWNPDVFGFLLEAEFHGHGRGGEESGRKEEWEDPGFRDFGIVVFDGMG